MLTELNISQFGTPVNYRKRWFQDDYFDLFTWQNAQGDVVVFQLCYDRLGKERVIIWDAEQGFAHHCVDDGESSPNKNMTPVFVSVAKFSYDEVVTPFIRESQHIDETIHRFVTQKLIAYTKCFAKEPEQLSR
ncbi:MAG: hypothetical protein BWK79_19415 [Beggiatoa sp. IS2]|nr:MAG: hypothetical protein BWK79_19415 [Beggiatoa sp. IS2]